VGKSTKFSNRQLVLICSILFMFISVVLYIYSQTYMYIVLAVLSAVFSSLTAIFGKKGLSNINSHVATFLRTGLVLVYIWCFVFITGAYSQIASLSSRNIIYLILSGTATGGSWLFYYKALSIGDVSRVTAIDKSSVLLTMLFGMIFLGEGVTALKLIGLTAIAMGTYLMIGKISFTQKGSEALFYALLSAVLAALTSIFAKIGINEIDANLATAIRTGIVLIFAGVMLPVTGSIKKFDTVNRRDLLFLCLSALSTSLAWLCYFNALQLGEASVVAPIDKLSVAITIGLSALFLREKISRAMFIGVVILALGTVMLVV